MSAEWLERLSSVAPSIGLMIETTSARLLAKGAAHDRAPDKEPAKRLRVLEDAGRMKIPFTTGILVGIGETLEERVGALIAIRELHEKHGHIQEVIVQNFRAKTGTPMAHWPEPDRNEMLRTLAVARLLMPQMNLQAPPNLSDAHYADLLDGGINDWGGVSPLTPDFINPEKPWPHLEQLRQRTEAKGFELRQRLPVYPEFVGRFRDQQAPRLNLLAQRLSSAADAEGYARRAA
jgi:FO synthase